MRTIKVVGAGFSGLVTAYYLVKQGFRVRIFEKSSRVGGLLRTIHTEHGPVETAANAIRNSARLEALCADIGVPLLPTRPTSRARFIHRGHPRRWPLTASDVLRSIPGVTANVLTLHPREFETIDEWGRRIVGVGATEYFLAPALSGIYAGDPKRLSASLIFRRTVNGEVRVRKPSPPKLRGLVAPAAGMQQLVDGLADYLEQADVEFVFNESARLKSDEPAAICTGARAAAECLSDIAPELSQHLRQIEMLPLVSTTCFYPLSAARLKGFGCLFPRSEGFRARGVLFNSFIFERRGPAHSETWIFGGALDREIVNLNDETMRRLVADERARFYGEHDEALNVQVTRWPEALPHYTIELERILATLPPLPPTMAFAGNYLGKIGLSGLIERAAQVAANFSERI